MAWSACVRVLLIGASTVFGQLQTALDSIWQVPRAPKQNGLWAFVRARLLSFGMVLGMAFVIIVSLLFSTVVAAPGETRGAAWYTRPEVDALATATLDHYRAGGTAAEQPDASLEAVWLRLLFEAGRPSASESRINSHTDAVGHLAELAVQLGGNLLLLRPAIAQGLCSGLVDDHSAGSRLELRGCDSCAERDLLALVVRTEDLVDLCVGHFDVVRPRILGEHLIIEPPTDRRLGELLVGQSLGIGIVVVERHHFVDLVGDVTLAQPIIASNRC